MILVNIFLFVLDRVKLSKYQAILLLYRIYSHFVENIPIWKIEI